MTGEIEPIAAEEAREILYAAIRERLGETWEQDGEWVLVDGHDYNARFTRGRINIDFYVDLLGKVTVEENEISPGQEYGRLLAWAFLLASLFLALLIARVAGLI